MIVKDHEKEALGFISVTWMIARAHVNALPGQRGAADRIHRWSPANPTAGSRAPLCAFRLPPWKADTGRRHGANDA
jgi:hypothetical protein